MLRATLVNLILGLMTVTVDNTVALTIVSHKYTVPVEYSVGNLTVLLTICQNLGTSS